MPGLSFVDLVRTVSCRDDLPYFALLTFALWTGLAVYRSVWVDEGCQAVLQN